MRTRFLTQPGTSTFLVTLEMVKFEQWKKRGELEATVRSTYRAAILPGLGWRCHSCGIYHRGYRGRGQATPTNWTVVLCIACHYCPEEDSSIAVETVGKNLSFLFCQCWYKKNEHTCYAYYPTKNLNILNMCSYMPSQENKRNYLVHS